MSNLMKEMEKDQESFASKTDDVVRLSAMCQEMLDLDEQISVKEAELKELENRRDVISSEVIPDLLSEQGLAAVQKALEDGLITKQDLSQGMYPGFTSWPTRTSGSIEGMSGIITDDGRELSNAEVYELMWQYDMPYNNDVERLKRWKKKERK